MDDFESDWWTALNEYQWQPTDYQYVDASTVLPGYDWLNYLNGWDYDYIDSSTALPPETVQQILDTSALERAWNTVKTFGADTIKKVAGTPEGGVDWSKVLALGAGIAGGTGLLDTPAQKSGYQGSIPTLTAVREAVPMERPADYRPGQGGQRYFSDVQYVAPAVAPVARQAATQQAQTLKTQNMAAGGLAGAAQGRYLRGGTDGMADEVDAQIEDDQPAKLSHGEFVIPADVVSHLGNGNSDAGADKLHEMMDRVRKARTGTTKQGKQINPDSFMPGGLAAAAKARKSEVEDVEARFQGGGSVGTTVPSGAALSAGITGSDQSLSSWAGPYVTNMLGKGQALSEMPYTAYQGPLTAGASNLQQQVFGQAADLNVPTSMGAFTPGSFTDTGVAQKYMNPYLQGALQPQIDEARRQAEIQRVQDASRLTKAGAFGGSRQAIMESEGNRNLLQNLAGITGTGYKTAYDAAAAQFNTEQARQQAAQEAANQFGLAALTKKAELGGIERGITAEGIAADKAAFEAERDYPYKMVQYQQSLLQGLPLAAQSYDFQQANPLLAGISSAGSILDLLSKYNAVK